jgi:hypothetical protein
VNANVKMRKWENWKIGKPASRQAGVEMKIQVIY